MFLVVLVHSREERVQVFDVVPPGFATFGNHVDHDTRFLRRLFPILHVVLMVPLDVGLQFHVLTVYHFSHLKISRLSNLE